MSGYQQQAARQGRTRMLASLPRDNVADAALPEPQSEEIIESVEDRQPTAPRLDKGKAPVRDPPSPQAASIANNSALVRQPSRRRVLGPIFYEPWNPNNIRDNIGYGVYCTKPTMEQPGLMYVNTSLNQTLAGLQWLVRKIQRQYPSWVLGDESTETRVELYHAETGQNEATVFLQNVLRVEKLEVRVVFASRDGFVFSRGRRVGTWQGTMEGGDEVESDEEEDTDLLENELREAQRVIAGASGEVRRASPARVGTVLRITRGPTVASVKDVDKVLRAATSKLSALMMSSGDRRTRTISIAHITEPSTPPLGATKDVGQTLTAASKKLARLVRAETKQRAPAQDIPPRRYPGDFDLVREEDEDEEGGRPRKRARTGLGEESRLMDVWEDEE